MKHTLLLGLGLLAGGHHAQAQQAATSKEVLKARMTTSICECLTQKSAGKNPTAMAKAQAKQVFAGCFGGTAGKEMKAIQLAYGKDSFTNSTLMRTMGEEIGASLAQDCPSAMGYYMAMAGNGEKSESQAATTGQTTGQLGGLSGPGVALLEVQVAPTEKVYFAWVRQFDQADELLRKLPDLKGRQARISWQEVEVLQPDTRQYQKVREITSIELL